MSYRRTKDIVDDLVRHDRCLVVDDPISPHLEMAEIQRRLYSSGGPAVLFRQPVNTAFPMVCNLFGTLERARFIFRDTLESVRRAIELKIEPTQILKRPWRYKSAPLTALTMQPRRVNAARVQANQTTIDALPKLVSWPDDGGPFITLPQVLSQHPTATKLNGINLGMYRIQMSGNAYQTNKQIGLHYQLHRGIGVHHQAAAAQQTRLPVTVTVGGHPAMTLAAVMPLPEGMSELMFAGALAGHRIPMLCRDSCAPIYADADFAIVGYVEPNQTLPEGPFGDHLGYYAKQHEFPVLTVTAVYHRDEAIWPFTVVGRPPQEDTTFGELIHELTGPILPTVIPGVQAVHAVDAAGVHPLLLAYGSERYTPYQKPGRPAELLTQACAILGQGQLSLAKYLFMLNHADWPDSDIHDTKEFFQRLLRTIDWSRDLHFLTNTTIDTLDYSGSGLNEGSKLIAAARGSYKRELATNWPKEMRLEQLVKKIRMVAPGIAAVELNHDSFQAFDSATGASLMDNVADAMTSVYRYCEESERKAWDTIPLFVLVDDAEFTSFSWQNFLWTTFTRSNPASDIYGIDACTHNKHWGCRGPLIIDAQIKPHHAPPLIESKEVCDKIDAIAARGGALSKYL